ncbi:hypothetical protein H920_12002 [Fukomys damarensis]|uniref:Uncharacterized protein n=1 Tax=Fukomys damarensis TaxID=885580 RepID=A0A091D7Y6_FUKDA|nr:hypothetical protein H920_12002 [Fukomys damarensis]
MEGPAPGPAGHPEVSQNMTGSSDNTQPGPVSLGKRVLGRVCMGQSKVMNELGYGKNHRAILTLPGTQLALGEAALASVQRTLGLIPSKMRRHTLKDPGDIKILNNNNDKDNAIKTKQREEYEYRNET